MTEKEFNLLYMRWIRVRDSDCKVSEVSLNKLFKNAHNYKDLCGELPTQDFAVMRLLLAILHAVFSRFDVSGKSSPLKDPDDALDRWQELWENGKFPVKVITDYLKTQRENFYLFHPERPFYQVERAKIGTEYEASKLNGSLSESGNKLRLFPNASGKAKEELTYSEAARWLVHLNAFDDCSLKQPKETKKQFGKLPSIGVGWLGRLGLISVAGNNLFETLMLNLIMVRDNGELYAAEKPIWEREKIPDEERKEIPLPDNLSELYTLQSRRLYLKQTKQSVIGYYLLGGDFFGKENAFIEPMTFWRSADSKHSDVFNPRRHDASRQFWRDFSSLVTNGEKGRRPGIVSWLNRLESEKLIGARPLNMKIASVQYGDKDFFVTNVFSDSLQMHAALISDMNPKWQTAVTNSVELCDKISQKVWSFAQKVDLAAGGSNSTKESKGTSENFADKAKADFFNRIDAPFREWLCALNPETDDKDESQKKWRSKCVDIARSLGEEIIAQTDSAAIFGRTIRSKDKKGSEQKQIYSAAEAMNEYLKALNKAKNL